MKKVAIICAAGKQGRLLVDEAVSRGYDVTGFVREGDKVANPKAKTVVKDLFDLTKEDLSGFDVVIDAFGVWAPEMLPLHKTSLMHLCNILSGTKVRLLVVGGAGSLYVNREHTVQVKDLESFPAVFLPLATNMGEALGLLRGRSDVQWTYLSPAGDFVADGERTGTGVFRYANGDKYTGQFVEGDKEGRGTLVWKNGNTYTGQWKADKPNGAGRLTTKAGDVYEGQFKDGKIDGEGIVRYADGWKFKGTFKDGRRNGPAIEEDKDGNRFEGSYLDDLKDGKFVEKDRNGNITAQGVYVRGQKTPGRQ